jgi:carbonic anhydrase
MNAEGYSRRRFVRHGLTLAGVTFAWSAFRSNSLARQAKIGQPTSPDEALAELLVGNKRYLTETLRNSEPVLADLVKQNRLRVVGGLYDLTTGRVQVLS